MGGSKVQGLAREAKRAHPRRGGLMERWESRLQTPPSVLLSCSPFHMELQSRQAEQMDVRKHFPLGPVCLSLRMRAFAFYKCSEVICALSGPDQQFLIVKNFSSP